MLIDARQRLGFSGADVARIGILAAAYFGVAKLGLALAFQNSSVTAIWPPSGLALAAVLLWGPRIWPGIALGALLANATTQGSALTVLGITAGNTLEALAGRTSSTGSASAAVSTGCATWLRSWYSLAL